MKKGQISFLWFILCLYRCFSYF